ncbi:unnamed protein product [Periconia digitata]|uniref:Clr5 domain-containing protein n=1 Tax=Periconia digitata TaxID=1303443 RepID=A0A9W4UK66_9PLEO|nr:unnamed protein product [Periconia digitata]
MDARQRSRIITSETWEAKKDIIRRLYIDEGKTLRGKDGIIDIMKREHGLTASKAQYEAKLRHWGFRKNATKQEWIALFRNLNSTRVAEQELTVYLYGGKISHKKLDKQRSTYAGNAVNDMNSLDNIPIPPCFRIEVKSTDVLEISNPSTITGEFLERITTSPALTESIHDPVEVEEIFRHPEFNYTPFEYPFPSTSGGYAPNSTWSPNRTPSPWQALFSGFPHDSWSSYPSPIPTVATQFVSPVDFASNLSQSSPTLTSIVSALNKFHLSLPANIKQISDAVEAPLRILLPSGARDLMLGQTQSVRALYFMVHAFANNLVNWKALVDDSDDPASELCKLVIRHFSIWNEQRFCSFLRSFPNNIGAALEEGIFRASVILGAHETMRVLLSRGLDPAHIWVPSRQSLPPGLPVGCLAYAIQSSNSDAITTLLRHGDRKLHYDLWSNDVISEIRPDIIRLLIAENLIPCEPSLRQHILESHHLDMIRVIDPRPGVRFPEAGFFQDYVSVEDTPRVNSMLDSMPQSWFEKQRHDTSFLETCLSISIRRHNDTTVRKFLELGARSSPHLFRQSVHASSHHAIEVFLDQKESLFFNDVLGNPEAYFSEVSGLLVGLECEQTSSIFRRRGLYEEVVNHHAVLLAKISQALRIGDSVWMDELMETCKRRYDISQLAVNEMFRIDLGDFYLYMGNRNNALKSLVRSQIIYSHSLLSATLLLKEYELANSLLNISYDLERSHDVLHIAVISGNLAMVRRLIHAGAPLSTSWAPVPEIVDWKQRYNLFGVCPLLTTAIYSRNQFMTDFLLDMGVSLGQKEQPHAEPTYYVSPLRASIHIGDHGLIAKLLSRGAQIHIQRNPHRGPKSISSELSILRNQNLIQLLIKAARTMNADSGKRLEIDIIRSAIETEDATVLYIVLACMDDGVESQSPCTLERYSFIEVREEVLSMGLSLAVREDSKESLRMTQALLVYGANPNYIYNLETYSSFLQPGRTTILASAASLGNLMKVQILVEGGGDIHAQAKWGCSRTALQTAAEIGAIHVVEYLLKEGARTDEAPAHHLGRTALQLAAAGGYIAIVALLIDHGASVNESPCRIEGRTAFEAAAENGRIDTLYFLAENGLDLISDGSAQRENAIWLAKNSGHAAVEEVVETLYIQACQQAGASRMTVLDADEPFI